MSGNQFAIVGQIGWTERMKKGNNNSTMGSKVPYYGLLLLILGTKVSKDVQVSPKCHP